MYFLCGNGSGKFHEVVWSCVNITSTLWKPRFAFCAFRNCEIRCCIINGGTDMREQRAELEGPGVSTGLDPKGEMCKDKWDVSNRDVFRVISCYLNFVTISLKGKWKDSKLWYSSGAYSWVIDWLIDWDPWILWGLCAVQLFQLCFDFMLLW